MNLVNDKGMNVPLQVNDNEDGSFLIDYVPTSTGVHSLNCTYGGVKVPVSPIKINVQSPVDVSKVKVEGLESRKFINVANAAVPYDDVRVARHSRKTCTRLRRRAKRVIKSNGSAYVRRIRDKHRRVRFERRIRYQ